MAISPALRYSTLPCPNGCFLSGLRLAILVPIIVIIEDRTSLRLLTASRVIAIELVKAPIAALKAARNRLAIIPIILTFIISFSLIEVS